jgi:hypothetical protein
LLRRLASQRTKKSGDIDETTNILIKRIEKSNADITQFGVCGVNLLRRSCGEYSQLRLTCQQQNALIEKLKSNQYMIEKNIFSIRQQMEDLLCVSYDGTLTWKISNFAQSLSE